MKDKKLEIKKLIAGSKIGSWKDWSKATKPFGGTKKEWNKLQKSKTWDETIDDILELLDKKEGI